MQRYLESVDGTTDKRGNPKTTAFNPRIALKPEWRTVMPAEKDKPAETAEEIREIIGMIELCLQDRFNIGEKSDQRQGAPKRAEDIKSIKTLEAWLASAKKDLDIAIKRESKPQEQKARKPGQE
jgi:hypothetical protein